MGGRELIWPPFVLVRIRGNMAHLCFEYRAVCPLYPLVEFVMDRTSDLTQTHKDLERLGSGIAGDLEVGLN